MSKPLVGPMVSQPYEQSKDFKYGLRIWMNEGRVFIIPEAYEKNESSDEKQAERGVFYDWVLKVGQLITNDYEKNFLNQPLKETA